MADDAPEISPQRRTLADTLRDLRKASDLGQRELARRAGWKQPKVSRIENGHAVPSDADIEAWTQAVGAGDRERAELVALAREVRAESTAWQALLGQDFGRKQRAVGELEQAARVVYHFQPIVVPGLLQTAEYARRMFLAWKPDVDRDQLSRWVAGRLQRQQILYDPSRVWEFIVTEGALRWRPGPPEVLRAQLGQVRSLASLENIRIGVVPFAQEAPVIYISGFIFYEGEADDDTLVTVETLTREQQIREPAEVNAYREFLDRLRAAALWDEDAVAFIDTITVD